MFNVILFSIMFFGWVFTTLTQQRTINKLQDRLLKTQEQFIYEQLSRIYADKSKEN